MRTRIVHYPDREQMVRGVDQTISEDWLVQGIAVLAIGSHRGEFVSQALRGEVAPTSRDALHIIRADSNGRGELRTTMPRSGVRS